MIKIRANLKITDMRKSIDGLSVLILDNFDVNPEPEYLFIFFNKAKDKIKILFWDSNGC